MKKTIPVLALLMSQAVYGISSDSSQVPEFAYLGALICLVILAGLFVVFRKK